MLEFPRWKYWLVVLVVLLGLLLALPNVFGEDPALQVALKSHAPMDAASRATVEQLLQKQEIPYSRDYVEGGRLVVAFQNVPSQLRARDAVDATLADTYTSALSNASRTPGWMRAMGLKPMPLGLDLRGGLYLLYQVDVDSAITQLLGSYEQSFRRTLADDHLPLRDITTLTGANGMPNGLAIELPPGANVGAVQAALAKLDNTLNFSAGNGANGPVIRMVLTPAQVATREDYAIQQNLTTLNNRVNEMGVSEPIVQRQGLDRIVVELPGVQNSADVKDLLGKVATLEFHLVDENTNPYQAQQSGQVPLGDKLYKMKDGVTPILLKREVVVTGDELTQATSTTGQDGPAVNIRLDARGAASMLRTTRQNVGHRLAVVYIERTRQQVVVGTHKIDRENISQQVISDATIRGVFGPQFDVTGLTQGEANDLALLLRSGSLAAPIEIVEENTIGPSLGKDNIDQGIRALEIGMLAVFVFMIVYYHAFGIVADAVLLANVVLLTALLSLLHASLSLPGIAGIILTVGIAVDANVLIYERIREELRNGVSPQAAVRAGFDKAFSAIFDSNITALISGLALYVIGTGPVRSFAIVLVLGIATSMFTSLTGSRALITLMYGGRRRIAKLSIG